MMEQKKNNYAFIIAGIMVLLSVTAAVYSYRLGSRGWYSDDYARVAEIKQFNSLSSYMKFWWSNTNGRLDCAVQYLLHKHAETPFASHLVCICVHLLNVILVFFLAWRLLGRNGAWFAALFFAFHPQGSRAVMWSTTLCYLLAATSLLIAAHLTLVRGRYYWLAQAAGALILLSGMMLLEQMIFMAPLLVFLSLKGREHNKLRFYLPALFFCGSSVAAVLFQRLIADTGKAHWISLQNMPGKIALQTYQAIERAVSPGLRQTVIPLLKQENELANDLSLLWIIGALTLGIAAWFWSRQPGSTASNRFYLQIAAKGLALFLAAYLIGTFAPHPYLAKRMFYIPSTCLSLTAAGLYLIVLKKLKNPANKHLTSAALSLIFAATTIPVIMTNAEFFVELSAGEKAVAKAISKIQKAEQKLPRIYLTGVPREGVYYQNCTIGLPFELPEAGAKLLRRSPAGVEWVKELSIDSDQYFSLPKVYTFKQNKGIGLKTIYRRYQNSKQKYPVATIGTDLKLLSMSAIILQQTEAVIQCTFASPRDPLLLHQVYSRLILKHSDNSFTSAGDDRKPLKKLDNNTYQRTMVALFPKKADVIQIQILFTAITGDPELAEIKQIAPTLGKKGNRLIFVLNRKFPAEQD